MPSAFRAPPPSLRTPMSSQTCASLLPYLLSKSVSGEPLRTSRFFTPPVHQFVEDDLIDTLAVLWSRDSIIYSLGGKLGRVRRSFHEETCAQHTDTGISLLRCYGSHHLSDMQPGKWRML